MSAINKLAGRTIFISGASRGIGKAIALKCAKDGANIVIAAKTAEAHPKLPGTIYTAAKEVEDAGGRCLPYVVDIRDEKQLQGAVNAAVKEFGGIDILVNNASAIQLTGTEATDMKRFDLMMGVNMRGTYLCSKYCIPHLKIGKNPHILNISPPLNMKPLWFKNHVAYTMAKYGMSMCVLGMAEEFSADGVAVNALWPRTAIYTAAMAMLGGGEEVKSQCRTDTIMSDAAYAVLTRDSHNSTGNFYIDDEVLREEGVTDLEQYSCVPGSTLLPDFFLDVDPATLSQQLKAEGASPKYSVDEKASGPAATFRTIQSMLSADLVKSINGVFEFDLKDDGIWYLDLKNGNGDVGEGAPPSGDPDCKMTLETENFVKMFSGKLNPTTAFMTGKLKIKGNMALAMKLEKLMKKVDSKL